MAGSFVLGKMVNRCDHDVGWLDIPSPLLKRIFLMRRPQSRDGQSFRYPQTQLTQNHLLEDNLSYLLHINLLHPNT